MLTTNRIKKQFQILTPHAETIARIGGKPLENLSDLFEFKHLVVS
jgi:hypothetical protein